MGERAKAFAHRAKAVLAFVLIALLGVFVFSNTEPVALRFFSLHLEAPASLIVLLSSVTGVVLWPLLRAVLGKSRV